MLYYKEKCGGGICYRYLYALIDGIDVIPNAVGITSISSSGFYNGNYKNLIKYYWVEWGNSNNITVQFEKPVNAIGVINQSSNTGDRWTRSVELQYSDDGSSWTTMGTKTYSSIDTSVHKEIFGSVGKHKYWKLLLQSYNSNWQGNLFDLIVKL